MNRCFHPDTSDVGAGRRALPPDRIAGGGGALFKQRQNISCAVPPACDFNPVFHRAVKDDVVTTGKLRNRVANSSRFPPAYIFQESPLIANQLAKLAVLM